METISLNFILALPKIGNCESILVITEIFSKYATYCGTLYYLKEQMGRILMKHLGVPLTIIND